MTYGLTNQEIITQAPAAGAIAPMKGASDIYSFVPTIRAVDLLRDAGWVPMTVNQSKVKVSDRSGFQKHTIRFTFPDFDLGGERIDIVLVNSHDRGCAFKILASVWRKICGNGLITSSDLASFSHKHIGFSSDDFLDSVKKIGDHAGHLAGNVSEMKAIELTPDERGIFASAAHQYIWGEAKRPPVQAGQLLDERRFDDQGKDLWTTFNVIQENVMKGGIKNQALTQSGKQSRRYSKPVESIDRDIKLNQALWQMAEQMKRLRETA